MVNGIAIGFVSMGHRQTTPSPRSEMRSSRPTLSLALITTLPVRALIAALALATVVTAGDDDYPAELVPIGDSAGVTIVESHAPQWPEGAGWRIAPEPLVEIGSAVGDPAEEFFQIEGVVRMADGRIAVGDGGAGEIRVFDSSGDHQWTAGRQGEGPGEFRIMASLGTDPDGGIWVYDFSLQRITFVSPGGEIKEVTELEHDIPTLGMVGRLRDGSYVLAQLWGAGPVTDALEEGMRRDPAIVAHFGAGGELVDTIGEFPGREIQLRVEDGRMVMGSPLYGRSASYTLWGNSLVAGDQILFELRLYSSSGELGRIVRIPGADLSLSQDEIESTMAQAMADLPESRRPSYRSFLEEAGLPDRKPAYLHLLPDRAGNLWVSEFARYPTPPGEWTVFDADGRWLGSVVMPPDFRPYEIGMEWILGVERDEMDVQQVKLYPLVK